MKPLKELPLIEIGMSNDNDDEPPLRRTTRGIHAGKKSRILIGSDEDGLFFPFGTMDHFITFMSTRAFAENDAYLKKVFTPGDWDSLHISIQIMHLFALWEAWKQATGRKHSIRLDENYLPVDKGCREELLETLPFQFSGSTCEAFLFVKNYKLHIDRSLISATAPNIESMFSVGIQQEALQYLNVCFSQVKTQDLLRKTNLLACERNELAKKREVMLSGRKTSLQNLPRDLLERISSAGTGLFARRTKPRTGF